MVRSNIKLRHLSYCIEYGAEKQSVYATSTGSVYIWTWIRIHYTDSPWILSAFVWGKNEGRKELRVRFYPADTNLFRVRWLSKLTHLTKGRKYQNKYCRYLLHFEKISRNFNSLLPFSASFLFSFFTQHPHSFFISDTERIRLIWLWNVFSPSSTRLSRYF